MGNFFIESLSTNPRFFIAVVFTVVLSIVLHELAHGVVAVRLGDRTPIERGHMTLNPLVHMGPYSLLMLALAGIAWGKMPVDPSRLRGRYGDVWVSLAGPVTNILLALLALLAIGLSTRFAPVELLTSKFYQNAEYVLQIFGKFNIVLAILNLVPIPPLDGSRIVAGLLPVYRRTTDSEVGRGLSLALLLAVFIGGGQYLFPLAADITRNLLTIISGTRWV